MVLGIWHFAAKSHVDVKRVHSRFGNIVSDTTARKALNSMTGQASLFYEILLRLRLNEEKQNGAWSWIMSMSIVRSMKEALLAKVS